MDEQEYIELLRLRDSKTALLNALKGMVGLVQLLLARDDLTSEQRTVLETNHRVIAARAAIEHVSTP